jgi:hypothetical protein
VKLYFCFHFLIYTKDYLPHGRFLKD